jgi:hypothetical protein
MEEELLADLAAVESRRMRSGDSKIVLFNPSSHSPTTWSLAAL